MIVKLRRLGLLETLSFKCDEEYQKSWTFKERLEWYIGITQRKIRT